MGKSTINGHFQKQTVSLPEGTSAETDPDFGFTATVFDTSQDETPSEPSKKARVASVNHWLFRRHPACFFSVSSLEETEL
jgi:hypothetical protein